MFKTKWRIVRDAYLGYEVQFRYWWWPWWIQASKGAYSTNTHATLESAKKFLIAKSQGVVYEHH